MNFNKESHSWFLPRTKKKQRRSESNEHIFPRKTQSLNKSSSAHTLFSSSCLIVLSSCRLVIIFVPISNNYRRKIETFLGRFLCNSVFVKIGRARAFALAHTNTHTQHNTHIKSVEEMVSKTGSNRTCVCVWMYVGMRVYFYLLFPLN